MVVPVKLRKPQNNPKKKLLHHKQKSRDVDCGNKSQKPELRQQQRGETISDKLVSTGLTILLM